jgi:hypothetical protein
VEVKQIIDVTGRIARSGNWRLVSCTQIVMIRWDGYRFLELERRFDERRDEARCYMPVKSKSMV